MNTAPSKAKEKIANIRLMARQGLERVETNQKLALEIDRYLDTERKRTWQAHNLKGDTYTYADCGDMDRVKEHLAAAWAILSARNPQTQF